MRDWIMSSDPNPTDSSFRFFVSSFVLTGGGFPANRPGEVSIELFQSLRFQGS